MLGDIKLKRKKWFDNLKIIKISSKQEKEFRDNKEVLKELSETFKEEFSKKKTALIDVDIEYFTSEAFAEFLQFFSWRNGDSIMEKHSNGTRMVTKYKLDETRDISRDLLRDRALQKVENFVPAYQLLVEYDLIGHRKCENWWCRIEALFGI